MLYLFILYLVILPGVIAQGERPRPGGERPRSKPKPKPKLTPPGRDSCSYSFTIQGADLAQHCQIGEVERIVADIKNEYEKITKENEELKKEIESVKKEYESMVETVKKLDTETSSWREIVEWPRTDPRFQPENDTTPIKKAPTYKDCQDAHEKGNRKEGIYNLKPDNAALAFLAYCDEDGWTVIQRRFDGSVPFFKDWNSYSGGFGQLSGELWLGNENIHLLTSQDDYELRAEMFGWNDKLYHSNYENFRVGSELEGYPLSVGNITGGNYIDVLTDRNGFGFSTYDRDNDEWPSANCAGYYRGGWWLKNCGSDINREWCEGPGCMSWGDVIVKKSLLKIRPMSKAVKQSRAGAFEPTPKRKPKAGKPKKPKGKKPKPNRG